MQKSQIIILLLLFQLSIFAQKDLPHLSQLDVLHYEFQIAVSDSTDEINGEAIIQIRFLKNANSFTLDLVQKGIDGRGMEVLKVVENEKSTTFKQIGEKLEITTLKTIQQGDTNTYSIKYKGIPADGLVIDKNKHGDRTFFGDNWPNRAHQWLPCIDHPSDKAMVDFKIIAPDHYQVVANGIQIEETNLDDERKLTHWKETVPLPMKVAVFGAARFGVQYVGETHGIPISSWIYRQDRTAGYYDYSMAKEVLTFFIENIGPYPYKKLANVQSKTRWGGMENASNIFYFENSVTGQRKHESLIAHEIAHQWFGNSASEKNWHHVWLSEGFATYGTNLYLEAKYGREKMAANLQTERQKVYTFANTKVAPIVDPSITDWQNDLLSANVYQRASFVLHMLRREIGDKAFWAGLKTYYAQFKNKNALTEDFQKVMEIASGEQLSPFFQQWIYRAEMPRMKVDWHQPKKKRLQLIVNQLQSGGAFDFPLDIQAVSVDGKTSKKWTVRISNMEEVINLKCKFKVGKIILDPDTWLLFTAKIKQTSNN